MLEEEYVYSPNNLYEVRVTETDKINQIIYKLDDLYWDLSVDDDLKLAEIQMDGQEISTSDLNITLKEINTTPLKNKISNIINDLQELKEKELEKN